MNKNMQLFDVEGIHLLGNFNNGSVIGLDEEGYQYIANGNVNISENKKSEINNAMHELGFYDEIISKSIDAAYLHVIDACNLHCVGCYSFVENRNKKILLSIEQLKIILDNLKSVDVKKLVISGGEPFLRNDLDEICQYAKEKCGIEFLTVISNGTVNIEKYYKVLPYIDQLNISIDGYDKNSYFIRDKGIMDKVLKTVEILSDRIPINLIVTLHKKNIQYMRRYSDLSKKMNVSFSFSIFTVDEDNSIFNDFILDDDDLEEIEEKLMNLNIDASVNDMPIGGEALICRSRCEAGNKLISIDARGDIYPCHMLHIDELKMGSALNQNIKDVVFNRNNIFQNIHVDNFETCSKCKYKYLCGGGCRGRSYLKNKNIYKKDSYCKMIYNYYEDLIHEVKVNLGV